MFFIINGITSVVECSGRVEVEEKGVIVLPFQYNTFIYNNYTFIQFFSLICKYFLCEKNPIFSESLLEKGDFYPKFLVNHRVHKRSSKI